jgi:hypothetical protein
MAMDLRMLAGLCCLPLAAAGADRLFGVKPGLWEISHESQSAGVPPIPPDVLAKLPPEQRARMEAALKARGAPGASGGGDPKIRRECITEDQLEDPFRPDDRPDAHCTHTIVSRSSSAAEIHLECTDTSHPGTTMNGTFHWHAPDKETMSGSFVMNMSDGQHTMTTTVQLNGKWLGSDCGSVKPHVRKHD